MGQLRVCLCEYVYASSDSSSFQAVVRYVFSYACVCVNTYMLLQILLHFRLL